MKLSEIKARCEDFRRDGEHTIGVNLTRAVVADDMRPSWALIQFQELE